MAVGNSVVTFTLQNFNTATPVENATVTSIRWLATENNPTLGRAREISDTTEDDGLATFTLARFDVPLEYLITLPNTQFFILTVFPTDQTIDCGIIPCDPSVPVPFEERDLTSTITQYRLASTKQDKNTTVVTSAAPSVSPAAADAGKLYRLTNAAPTFNLPITGLTPGMPPFYISSTNDVLVVSDPNVIECLSWDGASFTASSLQSILMYGGQLLIVRYTDTGVWAITGIRNNT